MKKLKNIIIIMTLGLSILFLGEIKNYAVNENNTVTSNNTNAVNGNSGGTTQNSGNTGTGGTTPSTNTATTNSTPEPSQNNNTTSSSNTLASGTTSGTTTTTSGGSNSSNTKNNTSTTPSTVTKSSNANLTTLGIKPGQYDFTGFNNDTLSYEAKVPEDVSSIEIFAILQDQKATIKGNGTRNLEMGKNALDVVITAEDGTTKTFTINVTRGEETVANTTDNGEGLKELSVEGLNLSPEFKTNVYEYRVKYIGEETKLNIITEPTNKDYIVEVTGNEDLQEGENTITILVSKSNGTNIATYQIIVNKSLVDEEAIAREKEAEENEKRQKTILIGAIIGAVVIVGIIMFLVIKRKRDANFLNDEDEVVSLLDEEDENSDDVEDNVKDNIDSEELPKALIGQNRKVLAEEEDEEKEEENFDEMPKNEIKEKYLNNFLNKEENYDELEEPRRRHSKGKRFKE